jgi:hypothetical protein
LIVCVSLNPLGPFKKCNCPSYLVGDIRGAHCFGVLTKINVWIESSSAIESCLFAYMPIELAKIANPTCT